LHESYTTAELTLIEHYLEVSTRITQEQVEALDAGSAAD
jgi:hypothetical protein